MWETIKSKLSSRKFWVALLTMIVGIMGALGADDNVIQLVSSLGMIVIPAIVYIFVEGKIDASALSAIDTDALLSALESYTSGKSTTSTETYTVTYNANGSGSGSVPQDSNKYAAGDVATVSGNTGSLAKDGYTFAGWNTASDGSGTTYAAGDSLVVTGNAVLYAIWTEEAEETASDTETTETGTEAEGTEEDETEEAIADMVAAVTAE